MLGLQVIYECGARNKKIFCISKIQICLFKHCMTNTIGIARIAVNCRKPST